MGGVIGPWGGGGMMSEGVALWWMKFGLVYTFLSKFGRYDDAEGGIHRLMWLLTVESQHGITSLHHASLSAETPTPLLTLPLRYWSRTGQYTHAQTPASSHRTSYPAYRTSPGHQPAASTQPNERRRQPAAREKRDDNISHNGVYASGSAHTCRICARAL